MKLEFYASFELDRNIEIFAETFGLTVLHKRETRSSGNRPWVLSGNQMQCYWFLWRIKEESKITKFELE